MLRFDSTRYGITYGTLAAGLYCAVITGHALKSATSGLEAMPNTCLQLLVDQSKERQAIFGPLARNNLRFFEACCASLANARRADTPRCEILNYCLKIATKVSLLFKPRSKASFVLNRLIPSLSAILPLLTSGLLALGSKLRDWDFGLGENHPQRRVQGENTFEWR
jgi:hypothetical protein